MVADLHVLSDNSITKLICYSSFTLIYIILIRPWYWALGQWRVSANCIFRERTAHCDGCIFVQVKLFILHFVVFQQAMFGEECVVSGCICKQTDMSNIYWYPGMEKQCIPWGLVWKTLFALASFYGHKIFICRCS